jgi:uncharacterized protein (TIGR02145 family)
MSLTQYGRTLRLTAVVIAELAAAALGTLCLSWHSQKLAQTPLSQTPDTLSAITYGTLYDSRDNKKYKTVAIGRQTWMAENLNYRKYGTTDSWCYDNSDSKCEQYGRLYSLDAAKTVCPAGWHLSTNQDWIDLFEATGSNNFDDTRLKSKTGWYKLTEHCDYHECPESAPGTDDFGFSALPGGYRNPAGYFDNAGHYGYWWTAPEDDQNISIFAISNYNLRERDREYSNKDAYSVRCVQDNP